jgi:nitroreductase
MDNLELLKHRRSVRAFTPKVVPRVELEKIIDAARFAPTARNVQPWQFVAITDKQKLSELSAMAENGRFLNQAQACIAVFCEDTKYYLEDGCAATCNILLAATALGIGSCWIAGDKKPYCGQVADLLKAPAGLKLVSLVALGFPLEKNVFKPAEKNLPDEITHWEKF